MAEEGTAAAQEAAAQQQFVTQRIYTKDISFESPMTPNVIRQEWKPAACGGGAGLRHARERSAEL